MSQAAVIMLTGAILILLGLFIIVKNSNPSKSVTKFMGILSILIGVIAILKVKFF
jgi:uncharacterized membrane protein HdeD (DUF308 family)